MTVGMIVKYAALIGQCQSRKQGVMDIDIALINEQKFNIEQIQTRF